MRQQKNVSVAAFDEKVIHHASCDAQGDDG